MTGTIKYIPGMEVGSCSPLNTTHLFSFTGKPNQKSIIRQILCKVNYNAKKSTEKGEKNHGIEI